VGRARAPADTLVRTRHEEEPMVIDPAELDATLKRLKRVQGQIGGIVTMIEQGRDCREIVTQVAAASKALDRAGFAIIATGLRECLLSDDSEYDAAQMEKLFLSLA
jgi:DNA-binding FrmR family transcriptional regulator